jgi:hypothetical protein
MGEETKNRQPVKLSHRPSCPEAAAKRLHGERRLLARLETCYQQRFPALPERLKYLEWNVGRELILFHLSKAREDRRRKS